MQIAARRDIQERAQSLAGVHALRDVVTHESEGESAIGTPGLTVTIGADGKAIDVLVANLHCAAKGGHSLGKRVEGGGEPPPLTPPLGQVAPPGPQAPKVPFPAAPGGTQPPPAVR